MVVPFEGSATGDGDDDWLCCKRLRGYWNLDWFGLVCVHGVGCSGAERVQGELLSSSHLSPIPLPLESRVCVSVPQVVRSSSVLIVLNRRVMNFLVSLRERAAVLWVRCCDAL